MQKSKKVKIICAPSNLGYSNTYTGTFPQYLRISGLFEMLDTIEVDYQDLGTIEEIKADKSRLKNADRCKLRKEIESFNTKLRDEVGKSIKSDNDFPLVIGGDHSVAIGSVFGNLVKRKRLGVIWLDAHPDIHTPQTTMTGWVYGMPSAVVLGRGDKALTSVNKSGKFIDPENFCILGAQFIDPSEMGNIKKFGTNLISLDNILEEGIGRSLERAVELVSRNTDYVHLSLDLDVVDSEFAPGTSEHSQGLLSYREIKYICSRLGEMGIVSSMDLVEGDPTKDVEGKTAKLSLELVANVLGKTFSEYDFYLKENRIS